MDAEDTLPLTFDEWEKNAEAGLLTRLLMDAIDDATTHGFEIKIKAGLIRKLFWNLHNTFALISYRSVADFLPNPSLSTLGSPDWEYAEPGLFLCNSASRLSVRSPPCNPDRPDTI
jgi:hypothetical protein